MREKVLNILQYGSIIDNFFTPVPPFSPSNALFCPKTCRFQKNIVPLQMHCSVNWAPMGVKAAVQDIVGNEKNSCSLSNDVWSIKAPTKANCTKQKRKIREGHAVIGVLFLYVFVSVAICGRSGLYFEYIGKMLRLLFCACVWHRVTENQIANRFKAPTKHEESNW